MSISLEHFLFFLLIVGACTSSDNYDPDEVLSKDEQEQIVSNIIRYAGKLPAKTSDEEKFNPVHNQHYEQLAKHSRLERYFKKDGIVYFLLSQPAPSLVEKRHATGGKLTLNQSGELGSYEEVFRTWKMIPDTLQSRSYMLFDKMVNGESLEEFYPQNSGKIEYIEFPDNRSFYDKAERKWKTISFNAGS